MTTSASSLGVILGRFQVHDLKAHLETLRTVKAMHEKVLIIVESAAVPNTAENPLDFASRQMMLRDFDDAIESVEVEDMADPAKWSAAVDAEIAKQLQNGQGATIYASGASHAGIYSGAHEINEAGPSVGDVILADEAIRASAREVAEAAKGTEVYRAVMAYAASSRYATAYQTVDVAIFNRRGTKILLARKPNEDRLRLIGGFSDPTTRSLADDARREVKEETGVEISAPEFVGSTLIDDWRYRGSQDSIKTALFRATHTSGEPTAQDDIAELRWVSVNDIVARAETMIVAEHQPLIAMLKLKARTPIRAYGYALLGLIAAAAHDLATGIKRVLARG